MGSEKRRSDRIMFTIPLRVHGTVSHGESVEAGGRTITVNRHGARIQVSRRLETGQLIRIMNLNTDAEANFRVVGPLTPPTERVGEYGVECLEEQANIWGIHFPTPAAGQDARALLECRRCHGLALTSVSVVEAEVLEKAGIITRLCAPCRVETTQGYPAEQLETASLTAMSEAASDAMSPAAVIERRASPRTPILVPIRIRDYYGGVEIAQTENAGKDGFCFTSEKEYQIGQGLWVTCPHLPDTQGAENRAQVVREQPLSGTNRRLYAVRCEQKAG